MVNVTAIYCLNREYFLTKSRKHGEQRRKCTHEVTNRTLSCTSPNLPNSKH